MAGVKISALPAVASAALTDIFPVVQGSVTSRESITQLVTLLNTNLQLGSSSQVTGLNAQLGALLPLAGGTMTGDLILNGNPSSANQAANKAYVDTVASGFTVILAAAAATTANLNATQAGAGVGATLTNAGAMVAFAVDGYSAALNDRILVKDQTLTEHNGIYTVTTVGSGAVNWVLTRATDYDQAAEIQPGTLVAVNNGTANAGTSWLQTATVVTVDTDPIVFSQFTFSATAVLLKANNLSDVASVTTSFNNISPLTTKGDLIGFAAANARVPVVAGNGKVLQVDSTAGVGLSYSTPTYPSISGTSRKMLVSDGTNNVYSTETWAVPGTSGNILTSDGTNWTSAVFSSAGLINIQFFTSSGTYTRTSGSTHQLVMCWAPGASGSGSNSATIEGPGGGAGAFSMSFISNSSNQTITIGTGGIGVNGNTGGNNGSGNSSFGTLVIAAPGSAGGAGGTGGAPGGSGGSAASGTGQLKLSGSAGCSTGNSPANNLGHGGSAPMIGTIAFARAGNGTGFAGVTNSGGGGSGKNNAAGASGAGGDGLIIVWEFA